MPHNSRLRGLLLTACSPLNQIFPIETRTKFIIGGAISLPVVCALAWFVLWPGLKLGKERHAASRAKRFLAAGDYANASISARKALALNPQNLDAVAAMASIAERAQSPRLLDWKQRLAVLVPSTENKLALASASLQLEQPPFPTAKKAMAELGPAASNSVPFQLLAAEMAVREKDATLAELHFGHALRLDPSNEMTRLNLMALKLASSNSDDRTGARESLTSMLSSPKTGLQAARWLIQDSVRNKDLQAALALSDHLVTRSNSTFADRLQNLGLLAATGSPDLAGVLDHTMLKASTNSHLAYDLSVWMLDNGLTNEVGMWWESLPPSTRTNMPGPLIYANLLTAMKNWLELESFLAGEPWSEKEFVRHALLSRTSNELKEPRACETRWRTAVRTAGSDRRAMAQLLELAAAWGWASRRADLLWEVFNRFPQEQWMLPELDKLHTQMGDTRGLHRLYSALLKRSPTNTALRNNVAATAMLLNEDLPAAHAAARELYESDPKSPVTATTYAFSLFLQSQSAAAAEVLGRLEPSLLGKPPFALYHAVVLRSLGETNRAAEYFAIASASALLPEERAMIPKE